MKLGAWLRRAVGVLRAADHNEPRAAADFLAGHALGCGRLDLAFRSEEELGEERLAGLEARLKRLTQGEPLQYVLGDVDFLGRVFLVDRRALIPRPETETLTEMALSDDELWSRPEPVAAIDVGTGAGCIAVTLALHRPRAQVEAVDISPAALELARENAARHGVEARVRFRQADVLEGVAPASVDVVVSNPPYVPTAEWARLPALIRQYEPRSALDGGEDGLTVIRRLVEQAAVVLKPGGRLWVEIGEDQGGRMLELMEQQGFRDNEVRSDLCGHERIATARR